MSESITTTVLPGQRIELVVPQLKVGETVEVTVVSKGAALDKKKGSFDLVGFLDSLPTGPRAFPTWEEYERHLQSERDAWDR